MTVTEVSGQDLPVTGLVVGTPSMSAIGRHLAERCPNLEVHVTWACLF